MPEMTLKDPIEVTLTAPTEGILTSVTIQVEIVPKDGAILIYHAPFYDTPVRVNGPKSVVELLTPEPKIVVQMVSGATEVTFMTLGYRDDRSR